MISFPVLSSAGGKDCEVWVEARLLCNPSLGVATARAQSFCSLWARSVSVSRMTRDSLCFSPLKSVFLLTVLRSAGSPAVVAHSGCDKWGFSE